MVSRRRLAALLCVLAGLPALAQEPRTIPIPPPPVPDGPPALPPPDETRPPTPSEGPGTGFADGSDGPEILPPKNHFVVPPWHPSPPPAAFAGSDCNFNAWAGGNVFSPDFRSYQILAGGYFSAAIGPKIPAFNYLPVTIRKGWMLTAKDDRDSIISGNWECLAGLTAAPITSKYGHYLAGPSFLLRKNFLALGTSCVPYTQLGAGFVASDAYKDQTQQALGQMFEFYLHAQVGLRYFVTDTLSIDLEGGLQHISSANITNRNLGVNSLGGQVGVTYHFPWGER